MSLNTELEYLNTSQETRTNQFNFFLKFVNDAKYKFQFNDSSFIATVGRRRSGKSVFCLGMACAIDPDFSTEQICFDLKDLKQQLTTKTKTSIVWEEVGTSAFARDFMNERNKILVKTLQVFGYKKLAILGNFQHMKFIDGDVRLQLDFFFKMTSTQEIIEGQAITKAYAKPYIIATDWLQEPFIAPYQVNRDGVFADIGYIPIPQMDEFFSLCGVKNSVYSDYLKKKEEYFGTIGEEEDQDEKLSKKEFSILQKNNEAFLTLASNLLTEKAFTKKEISKLSGVPVTTLSRRLEDITKPLDS